MSTIDNPNNDLNEEDDIPQEIDFSNAEVGKFHRPNAVFHIPVYLDSKVQAWLMDKATKRGLSLEDIANELLKREIETIEAMK